MAAPGRSIATTAATAALLAGLLALPATAAGERPNQLTFGSFGLAVEYDDSFVEDDELGGGVLSYTRVFDPVSLRVNFYSLEHDDIDGLEADGGELLVLAGRNLGGRGFKIYGGGGVFGETWESDFEETDISGLTLVGGLGANWQRLVLDFSIGLRASGDYEDRINPVFGREVEAAAARASLRLGFRF